MLSRSPVFADLAEHPVALRLPKRLLGWPMLLGNLSANITGPGGGEMVLHADQIFVPTPWPTEPQGADAAWCVDDFTASNGATCSVPGSHLVHRPPESGDDVVAVPMEAPAGALVVFESRLSAPTAPATSSGPGSLLGDRAEDLGLVDGASPV